jgi:DNA-binding MarR family transcriptional regulator
MSDLGRANMFGTPPSEEEELGHFYRSMTTYIERLHRLMLDVLKAELDRDAIGDINAVQALLLHNIGKEEMTAGELKSRGYYQGSNVSYNLKKLVEAGYICYERSHIDRRSVRVKLSESGLNISKMVQNLYNRQVKKLMKQRLIDVAGLEDVCLVMRDFERFWTEDLRTY